MDKKYEETPFEMGQMDKLIERVEADQSGKLKKVMSNIVFAARDAARAEVPLEELATICTLGWYMGSQPEIEHMFNLMLANVLDENQKIN